MEGKAGLYFYGVLVLCGGINFLRHGRRRDLRERRADPEAPPVVRSDRADRVVQIACFFVGGLFVAGGLFMLLAAFLA